MAIEHEILPFFDWLMPQMNVSPGAILGFLLRAILLLVMGLVLSYLLAALRHGPSEAFYLVSKVLFDAVGRDLPNFSFPRTYAVARLAILESIRRRVIVAFAVFVIIVMFAGWFLDRQSDNPARLYIGFVLGAANLLVLLLTLFLSTFSLPNDIKNKTIYTVVTKPVRAGEIVLGRILGFAAVGTALLIFTGIVSYIFVVRGLAHQHFPEPGTMTLTEPNNPKSLAATGKTSRNALHRHEVTIGADGIGQTDTQMGHWHPVTAVKENGQTRYVIGPHEGMLLARVPHYGKLSFRDMEGNAAKSGISVGQEWTYRGYIAGRSKAAGIWSFTGITPRRYPDGLDLETDIRIFRTYKGNIEKGILGKVTLYNKDPNARISRSEPKIFTAVEFELGHLQFGRKLKGLDQQGNLKDIDLFNDLVHNGELEIHLQCAEQQQYFGMAQPDLYIKATEAPFWQNFVKGYIGIWLQMLIVTALGVTLSTFLSAPVALLGTIGGLVLGYFGSFIAEVAKGDDGEAVGGGPLESFIRIITQVSLMVKLEIGDTALRVLKGIDWVLLWIMQVTTTLIPNLSDFDATRYVAYGYDINANLLSQHISVTFAFVLVAAIVGYFMLKTREIAA